MSTLELEIEPCEYVLPGTVRLPPAAKSMVGKFIVLSTRRVRIDAVLSGENDTIDGDRTAISYAGGMRPRFYCSAPGSWLTLETTAVQH